jgi:N-acetylneuraminic acid mutarotase
MTSPPEARTNHTAVWTGSKMIVWGGMATFVGYFNTGGIWTPGPGGGSWTALDTLTDVPDGRENHTAVWTGSKMVVWGGYNDTNGYLRDGGVWEDTGGGGTWTQMPTVGNMPSGRELHTAVWTGSEMVIWGGANLANGSLGDGGIWQDSGGAGTWIAGGVSAASAPEARQQHTAVWTGSEMIVWGGFNDHRSIGDEVLANGGIWTSSENSWQAVPETGSPSMRYRHAAAWVGGRMVVWGGFDYVTLGTGDIFDPSATGDAWSPATQVGAPVRRLDLTAVSTGSQMVVWGGANSGSTDTGGAFDVPGESIEAIRSVNASALPKQTMMLSGARVLMIADEQPRTRIYCAPNATIYVHNNPTETVSVEFGLVAAPICPDYWLLPDTATSDMPEGIVGAQGAYLTGTLAADQTGACVWGGATAEAELVNTGSFFNETTLTWHAMDAADADAPSARIRHACVALGEKMLVWGGQGVFGLLDDGAIYDRSGDTWEALAVDAAQPSARAGHGSTCDGAGNVYVFGGVTASGVVADGGMYVDGSGWSTDHLDASGVLAPRVDAFVFWSDALTDDCLIVWGGNDADGTPLCDGATYAASTWTALPSTNAPPQGYGRQACIAPGGHLLVYGGLIESPTGGLVYDHNLYDFDPDAGAWASPHAIGNPCRPHLGFRLFHTGLGSHNNLLMVGGFVGAEPVAGFVW